MIFYKTSSSGNDFIHIDLNEYNNKKNPKSLLVKKLCTRKTGIGADGLVFYKIDGKIVHFEIYNQNGTEAELSGNGMAGLSALLFYLNKFKKSVTLKTKVGPKKITYLYNNKNKYKLEIEIGKPDFFNKSFFPFLIKNKIYYELKNTKFYPVSVGNPHIVIFLEKKIPEKKLTIMENLLEKANIFPLKTNIEFVQYKNKNNCRVFYYERGVGRTSSSSTGSAAVFAVLKKIRLIEDELMIQTPIEKINISGKRKIYIENSTEIVYKGICLV